MLTRVLMIVLDGRPALHRTAGLAETGWQAHWDVRHQGAERPA
jgi:hypothetical protein